MLSLTRLTMGKMITAVAVPVIASPLIFEYHRLWSGNGRLACAFNKTVDSARSVGYGSLQPRG
jgi:hypothetical protein